MSQYKEKLVDGRYPASPQDVFDTLDRLGIPHSTITHPPLYTVEDAKALRSQTVSSGETIGHVKNLFLRNKKGAMWLVTCHEDTPIDLKSLGERLGAGRLSFGSAGRLGEYLGIVPGAVSPLAVINDKSCKVGVCMESSLMDYDTIYVHPLVNTMTTALTPLGLESFLRQVRHSPNFLDF